MTRHVVDIEFMFSFKIDSSFIDKLLLDVCYMRTNILFKSNLCIKTNLAVYYVNLSVDYSLHLSMVFRHSNVRELQHWGSMFLTPITSHMTGGKTNFPELAVSKTVYSFTQEGTIIRMHTYWHACVSKIGTRKWGISAEDSPRDKYQQQLSRLALSQWTLCEANVPEKFRSWE